MSAPAKRACDACHRRKVRCNGANPCQNCVQASLACTFNKPPQKKGPKGSRAKVISELRKNQERPGQISSLGDPFSPQSGGSSPTFSRHDLLTPDLIETSIAGFFEKLYPTLPIINQAWLQQKALEIHSSAESYCLIGSLCAFMVIQPNVQLPVPMSPSGLMSITPMQQAQSFGMRLVDDVKRTRGGIDYGDNPSTAAIVTAFLISAACFGLEKHTTAWFHLQEAILFARMLRIHDEKSYRQQETPLDTMNRRLFWILYVSERAQALQKHRDLTFRETIAFPKPEDNPLEAVAIPGLSCLFNLFRVVDDRVSEIWNNLRAECSIVWPPDTQAWLTGLQRQLTDAIPPDINITEIQEVDVKFTQLWLRTVVWQLSTASGCLSSTAPDDFMTFHYPIELGREVVALTTRVSLSSMEAHGIGLVEKLFDIAYTLIDVMTVVPLEQSTPHFAVGPRDHLAHILYLITTLRGGETRYATLLHAKIREALPSLATSLGLPPGSAGTSASGGGGHHSLDHAAGRIGLKYEDSSTGSGASSPYGSPPAGVGAGGILGGVSLNQRYVAIPPSLHGPGPMGGPVGGSIGGPPSLGASGSGRSAPSSAPDSPIAGNVQMGGMAQLPTSSAQDGPVYGIAYQGGNGQGF